VTLRRAIPVVAIAIVALGVALALFMSGAPWSRRKATLDELRLGDLYRIADHFRDMRNRHEPLPSELPQSISAPYGRMDDRPVVTDPETGNRYTYHRTNGERYVLCANFDTSTQDESHGDDASDRFWAHPQGRKCFTFDLRATPLPPKTYTDVGPPPPFG
jgi:hypothetical protein